MNLMPLVMQQHGLKRRMMQTTLYRNKLNSTAPVQLHSCERRLEKSLLLRKRSIHVRGCDDAVWIQ